MRQTRISLFLITAVLLAIGVVMIYSASAIYAYERFGDSLYFLRRHLFHLILGAVLACVAMAADYANLKRYARPIFLASVLILVLVLLPAFSKEVSGARRWFKFLWFSLQPSEVAKLAVIIYLADLLSRKQPKIKSFVHGFLPPVMTVGLVTVLVLLQPDLGTAVAIMAVALMMFLVSGIDLRHVGCVFFLSIPVFYGLVFNVPYRRMRILAFLNPWKDPRGSGFQIIQSFIALGSGGLLGIGLGASRQKLFYLPQAHTDFIFSIIGEELGLLGTLTILLLFALFLWQSVKIALKARDMFGQLLGLGIFSMVGLEALINIGVATGSIPTKGLPLPFISYGGTALVCKMVAVGLLLNVAKNRVAGEW